MCKFALILLLSAVCAAQGGPSGSNYSSSGSGVSITTVAGLASVSGKTKGTIASVTDGNSATDCTVGGGSTGVSCLYSGTVWAALGGSGAVSSVFSRTGVVLAVSGDYTLDLIGAPAADKTFIFPIASTVGLTLGGTAPASVATATGTNAIPVLTVNGVTGGADSNATGTGGIGSQPSITAGPGGAGTSTNTVGGAGGSVSVTAGNGGASTGNAVNSNGGNITLTPGAAGSGASGTAGKAGVVQIAGPNAGFFGYQQGAANTTANANIPANTIVDQAPTAVTAGIRTIPGVLSQGQLNHVGGSTALTEGYSGDSNYSATVTTGSGTSVGSTSLCSTTFCPVGTYRVNVYIDITTACATSGTYVVNLIYTDDQGSKTIPVNIQGTGAVPATGVLTTTSTANFGSNSQIIRSTGGASINYSTTAVACGTAGPMVGKLYLSVEPIQ